MDILFRDVFGISEGGVLLGLDDDILQFDALDRHLGQTVKLHSTSGTIANDVLNVDIAEDRCLLRNRHLRRVVGIVTIGQHLGYRLAAIIHIERNGIGLDVCHGDVADEDVLYDTPTTTCRLKAQTDIRTQELTVLYQNVSDTATHLGTDNEATMSGEDRTAVDYHIFAGTTTTAAVGIFTALNADAVITGIELRIDDEGVLARFQIKGIAILCVGWIAREDIIDNDILTH